MTYEEAIAFWYGRIDYERRQPRLTDLKLDRMRSLLHLLGDPQKHCPCVHIAGTKGKGSSSAFLASILKSAGYRVGLFTSPHLSDHSERVQVDNVPICHEQIAILMAQVADAVSKVEVEGDPTTAPTFFEVITALGFLHFRDSKTDIVILEVGLGGKYDSTNVCEPVLSMITNISYDHMAILGNSLTEIANQKAGIIKPNIPVITTAEAKEAREEIARIAKDNHSRLIAFGDKFDCEYRVLAPYQLPEVRVKIGSRQTDWMAIGLFGKHQAVNASGVVVAVELLRQSGLKIRDEDIQKGLKEVVWPARIELMHRDPVAILDCAHNEESIESLIKTLKNVFPVQGKKHVLFAASSDKQIPEMLNVIRGYFDCFHLTRYESNPRWADPEQMASLLCGCSTEEIFIYPNPKVAWKEAWDRVGRDGILVVTGSVFLAGELRPVMLESFGM